MTQPVLRLFAVVESWGQSSVGPANYLLLETAALRLVLAQGFLRQHLQSRPRKGPENPETDWDDKAQRHNYTKALK